MINQIVLQTGIDIPFEQAGLIIHQPTIEQISFLGDQKNFFNGCNYLTFSKNVLSYKDKNNLQNLDDFDILMTVLKEKDATIQYNKVCMQLVLSLLFPEYKINFLPFSIMLLRKENDKVERFLIDKNNFNSFKIILTDMFCLQDFFKKINKYDPAGVQSEALVKKFEERARKLAKIKGQKDEGIKLLSKYISVLSVGENKDKNELKKYTVFQLFDEYNRFIEKQQFDFYISAKLAGVKDLEEIQDWTK